VVGPQVAVVAGPRLTARVPAVPGPVGPYSSITLGLVAVGSLAMLWAAGMGWSVVVLRRWLRPLDLCCIAPAVGIAALVLGGVLVDRIGVRLTGLAGAATPVAVAAAGWAMAAVSVRRRLRSSVTPA
jgi:hypothetical protein